MDTSQFTQSQGHGLYWDSEIRETVFKINGRKNDTGKYDVFDYENRFDSNENISIKTSSGRGFGCGDILRFFDRDLGKKTTIILIRYRQQLGQKKVKEVIEINYSEELKNYLFGDATRDILVEYVDLVKSIPSGVVDVATKKNYKLRKKEIQKDCNMIININPKVDSKSQRRVQCSVSNLDKIIEDNPNCVISRTESAQVRGIMITESINSEKRKRNKK